MVTNIVIHVNEEHVSMVMGIPSNVVDVVVHNRRATSNRTYNLSLLEQNLDNLSIGDEFLKTFLIFSYATMLTLNSKLEGMHDLWDTIWDGDVVQKYWSKFVLYYLEDGIKDYRKKRLTYIWGCLMFLLVQ